MHTPRLPGTWLPDTRLVTCWWVGIVVIALWSWAPLYGLKISLWPPDAEWVDPDYPAVPRPAAVRVAAIAVLSVVAHVVGWIKAGQRSLFARRRQIFIFGTLVVSIAWLVCVSAKLGSPLGSARERWHNRCSARLAAYNGHFDETFKRTKRTEGSTSLDDWHAALSSVLPETAVAVVVRSGVAYVASFATPGYPYRVHPFMWESLVAMARGVEDAGLPDVAFVASPMDSPRGFDQAHPMTWPMFRLDTIMQAITNRSDDWLRPYMRFAPFACSGNAEHCEVSDAVASAFYQEQALRCYWRAAIAKYAAAIAGVGDVFNDGNRAPGFRAHDQFVKYTYLQREGAGSKARGPARTLVFGKILQFRGAKSGKILRAWLWLDRTQ